MTLAQYHDTAQTKTFGILPCTVLPPNARPIQTSRQTLILNTHSNFPPKPDPQCMFEFAPNPDHQYCLNSRQFLLEYAEHLRIIMRRLVVGPLSQNSHS
jgi:hypothetical protein